MATLPDRIPVHFNVQGAADRYGDRSSLLGLLIPAAIIYVSLTVLWSFPRIYNYPVRITVENAARQYALAARLILLLKTEIMALFFLLAVATIESARSGGGLPGYFLPAVLVTVFGTLAWYLVAARRAR